MEMRKARFGIDSREEEFVGYTTGALWNGWATPYFTKEVADEIMKIQNQSYVEYGMDKDGYRAVYNAEKDQYEFYDPDLEEPEIFDMEICETVDGKLHLYGIGAYCWIWDEIEEEKEIEEEQVYITLDPEELMALGFVEQPDKEQITNAIHGLIGRQRTNRVCFVCGNPVYKSDVEGYPYVCYHCDENMYSFETEEVNNG
jgi:hypothetical protein